MQTATARDVFANQCGVCILWRVWRVSYLRYASPYTIPKTFSITCQCKLSKIYYAHVDAVTLQATAQPLFGPVAGGTRVTISGENFAASNVTAVLFGRYESYLITPRFVVILHSLEHKKLV